MEMVVATNAPMRLFALLLALFALSVQHRADDGFQRTLGHLRARSSPEVQAKAAEDVAARLLGGEVAKLFLITVDPDSGPVGKDTFMITKNPSNRIEITGTSGVAATWGLQYYLKNFCNVHIAWEGSQIALPKTLPDVRVKITSNDRFRYYQNVCTAGYSSVWWQWDQWEKNIDWMALNGINLALAFNGQEATWQRVYADLNLTRAEIDEHFGGPAFLPWTRMGNIRGFGGPLPSSWHEHTIRLQHMILQRMRDLGIIPVLPAFGGHVPRAFRRLFPAAKMTKVDSWNSFEDKYCCPYLLDPTDPLFETVGRMFLEKVRARDTLLFRAKQYIDEFGTDHAYNCDTFNENEPGNSELAYLRNVGRSVFAAMTSVDPKAICVCYRLQWSVRFLDRHVPRAKRRTALSRLMQGWLFVHDISFWTEARVEAFVTSVPRGRMIVLDLQSEQFPQYGRLRSYYGQPFIWCMLHNFGGTLGMFGSAQIVNQRVFEGRSMQGGTMVGTGLTPEGINQNYVIYELMNEMAYRREPVDLDAWFENYATRRYGAWNEYSSTAWRTFGRTIYNFIGVERIRGRYVITGRPSLKLTPWTWYDREAFFVAWGVFLKVRHGRGNSTLYKHDTVDITRQALQLTADDIYANTMSSFKRRNITSFRSDASRMLELFDDLELILSSGGEFLLGRWLEAAEALATNEEERKLYEYNARNQITLWGPRGEIRDYANKQWSGVVRDYFKPRWAVFLAALEESIAKNLTVNTDAINERIFREVERPFAFSNRSYPAQPEGDSIDIAVKLHSKWYLSKKPSRNTLSRITRLPAI